MLHFTVCTAFFRLMNTVRAMEGVKYVERNQIVQALHSNCEEQPGPPWNLARITTRDWDPVSPYKYWFDKKGKCSADIL